MGVVDQAIQDGVRQGGITGGQRRMPGFDRQLADDQRRAHLAAIVDDLQQILGFDDAGRGQQKIVQYQHADLGQVRQTPHIASVTAAERQIRQQPRCAHVQRRVATANGGVGQRATDE